VSPRWRDELRLLLTPQRAALQRFARGLRRAPVQRAQLDAAPGAALDWTPALEALGALLAAAPARGADATVIVSSHFVRYGLVPASELLVTQEDEVRFARHNFMRVHGAAAEHWSVRVSPGDGTAQDGGLASGMEQALVDALRALLERHGLRPRALQPALMAAFNHARLALPAGGCRLIVHEPGIAVSALLAPGWRRVRSQRVAEPAAEALAQLLEREQVLEDEAPADVPICLLPLLPLAQPLPAAPGAAPHLLEAFWPESAQGAPERSAA